MSPIPGARVAKIGVEMFDDLGFAADHHAISAFQSPYAAAGADIHVVDALCGKLLRAADVVDVVGVAAIDQDVAGFEQRQQVGDRLVDDCRRTISQIARGLASFPTNSASRRRPLGLFRNQILRRPWATCRIRHIGGRSSAGGAPCSRPCGPARSFQLHCSFPFSKMATNSR